MMPRRPSRKRMGEYATAALLSFVVLWLLYLVWGIARKEEVARHAAHDMKTELATLDARKQNLQSNLTELSTTRGEEATLRENYGVAKPGEEVIIVVPAKVASTTPPVSFWQKAFGWLVFWK